MQKSQSPSGRVPGRGYKRFRAANAIRPEGQAGSDRDLLWLEAADPNYGDAIRSIICAGWLISFRRAPGGGGLIVTVLHGGTRSDYEAANNVELSNLLDDLAKVSDNGGALP